MVINHTIKLATLDHIKIKYKWDPSLWDLKGGQAIIYSEELVSHSSAECKCINHYNKVYDVPLFQYEREDSRRVDLEVVMVRARKGGRTSWPLPVKRREDYHPYFVNDLLKILYTMVKHRNLQ